MTNSIEAPSIDRYSTFMLETDPHNPFGSNYIMRSRNEKLFSKFKLMRKYVNLSLDDSEILVNQNFYFYSRIGFGGLTFLFPTWSIIKFLSYKNLFTVNKIIKYIIGTSVFCYGVSNSYNKAFDILIKNSYNLLLEKYLPKAIENGFEDYNISSPEDIINK